MKSWRISTVLLLCLVLTSSVACNPFDDSSKEEISWQSAEVVRGDLTLIVNGSGNMGVSDEARLAFGSGGKVDKVYIEEGDRVSRGDKLARLDTGALELALAQAQAAQSQTQAAQSQAQAAQSQAQATRAQAQASIAQAQAAIAQAQAAVEQAEYELNRFKVVLHASQDRIDVAECQLEAARQQLEAAGQQLEAAGQQLEATKLQIEAAESNLHAAERAVAQAQKQLGEATIYAPFDGVAASVGASEGDIISAPTIIVYLIDTSTMELNAEVDEIDIAEVRPGQRAIIEVDALPEEQFDGVVTLVGSLPIVEAGLVLYKIKVGFDIPEGSELKVGMSATADIVIQQRSNVLLVPNRAIKQDSQGNPVVRVKVNEQLEERSIVMGISDGFQTEIISGLKEGEMVVWETRNKSKSSGPGLFFGE